MGGGSRFPKEWRRPLMEGRLLLSVSKQVFEGMVKTSTLIFALYVVRISFFILDDRLWNALIVIKPRK